MTGKLKDHLADMVGVYGVSKHDNYHLQIQIVDGDGEPPRGGHEWVLDDIQEPGRYVIVKVSDPP